MIKKFLIEDLKFKFTGTDNYFFENESFEFCSKKINFIKGSNGSGKSTLFNILLGKTNKNDFLDAKLNFENKSYKISNNNYPSFIKNKMNIVSQNFDEMLVHDLTAKKNLKLANITKYPGLNFLHNNKFLNLFENQYFFDLNTNVYNLSGGQRQILSIIMSLQKTIKVLLLDEPTAALDEENSKTVFNLLTNLTQNSDLIIAVICHDNDLIKQYSTKSFLEIKHANKKTGQLNHPRSITLTTEPVDNL